MSSSQLLIAVPLLLILGFATLSDWREHKVPNVLTFGGALFAFVLQWTLNGGSGLVLAATGWLACLACFLPLYMRRGMAAGDVKLMAVVGAFIGPVAGVVACAFSLIAGGLVALISLAVHWHAQRNSEVAADGQGALRSALQKRIPYAGAIAAGTSIVVLVPSVIPPALSQFGA
ncbi:MAG: prepilin peptidase [Gammaproteobacteria bacterium]|jgi:prepilin peptidase CpaA